MIRSVAQVPDDIMQQIAFLDKPKAHEIKLLQDLCGILRPFEEATNIAQGQNIVTGSEVIICVRSLREQREKLAIKYNCQLVTSLQNALDERLSKFESMEIFKLATVLDPKYKLDWCTDEEVERQRLDQA
uniref:Uncharacterized protein n=1 Tax=Amphimedon queenslandica TaxID=400682 RepID=A0A1X7UC99_AMPQE